MFNMNCQYHIRICFLCQSDSRIVRLKSFSAEERILTIDGGGIRRMIPLNILLIIERMMENEMQIQNLFNIAFGTSVGQSRSLTLDDRFWSWNRWFDCLYFVFTRFVGFSMCSCFLFIKSETLLMISRKDSFDETLLLHF